MKKLRLAAAALIASAMVFTGCDSSLDVSENVSSPDEMRFVIQLPGGARAAYYEESDATSYTVELKLGDSIMSTKTGLPGSSVSFTVTEEGSYTIKVSAYKESLLIAEGQKDAVISFGDGDVNVKVTLKPKAKDLNVNVDIEWGSPVSGINPAVELPPSVGENPFAGKTFTPKSDIEGLTLSFDDYTLSLTVETYVLEAYYYSYDTENSMLYLALKYDALGTEPVSSIDEYETLLKKLGISGAELEYKVREKKSNYSTMYSCKYEIKEENEISFIYYFTGTMPTFIRFKSSGFNLWADQITFDQSNAKGFLTFEDGNFTGEIYNRNTYEYIGTMSGTYECSGTGTENCTVTITVTELPETVTEIEKNKPIVLNMQ